VLLTCSVRVAQRTDCPPAVQLDNRDLHRSLLKLCRRLNVPVNPDQFLTVCVKCNGRIFAEEDWGIPEQAHISALRNTQRRRTFDGLDADAIKQIISSQRIKLKHGDDNKEAAASVKSTKSPSADIYFPDHLPLFMCTNPDCHQIYWFSEGENSSAVRSKALAEQLYAFIQSNDGSANAGRSAEHVPSEHPAAALRGFGGSTCDTSVASSAYRSRIVARCAESAVATPTSVLQTPEQFSAESEVIEHSLRFQSPYAFGAVNLKSTAVEDQPITTVRDQFHGMIDHIFYTPQHLKCTRYIGSFFADSYLSACQRSLRFVSLPLAFCVRCRHSTKL